MPPSNTDADKVFAGPIPELYQRHMVPMLFEPYAIDLAGRLASHSPARVLELAAGTGVVTRHLASTLPASTSIVATDLNPAMLQLAETLDIARPVTWRAADAMQLPFDDASFDAVVCQFGVMFFPDKPKAYAEARRVLAAGGLLLFNVWDGIEQNEFADTVTRALAGVFPKDPPRFVARTPHGYHDVDAIRRDLAEGGFAAAAEVATIAARSRAASAAVAATALCQGTPLRGEIEARGASRLQEATEAAAQALTRQFGDGAIDGRMQAHVFAVGR